MSNLFVQRVLQLTAVFKLLKIQGSYNLRVRYKMRKVLKASDKSILKKVQQTHWLNSQTNKYNVYSSIIYFPQCFYIREMDPYLSVELIITMAQI